MPRPGLNILTNCGMVLYLTFMTLWTLAKKIYLSITGACSKKQGDPQIQGSVSRRNTVYLSKNASEEGAQMMVNPMGGVSREF